MYKRIYKKRFLGLHIGEIFRGQIHPFYIIRLGTYTYYYFVIIDLYNEMLLSVSTTSTDVIKKTNECTMSEEASIFIGKYALTFQDRVLTCGSLKVFNSKNPSFRKMPEWLKSGVNHIERFIKTPSLYSQLALFPAYISEGSHDSWRLYNKNTWIIVNPEGQFCRAGLILGNVYLIYKYVNTIDKLPYIEYYPNTIVEIKSIACRPSSSYTESPLKCYSIRLRALVNKALVPRIMSSRDSTISGLLYVNWCPKLKIGMPVLVGFKDVNAEELANFIFGKALLLSSLEGDKFQVLIPEERLWRIYDTLIREINYRLGIMLHKNIYIKDIIKEHEQRNLLIRLQKKLVPITMQLYLRNMSIFNSSLKQIMLKNMVHSLRENNKKSIGFSIRESIVMPLECYDDAFMII
jgi:hypothetical protein